MLNVGVTEGGEHRNRCNLEAGKTYEGDLFARRYSMRNSNNAPRRSHKKLQTVTEAAEYENIPDMLPIWFMMPENLCLAVVRIMGFIAHWIVPFFNHPSPRNQRFLSVIAGGGELHAGNFCSNELIVNNLIVDSIMVRYKHALSAAQITSFSTRLQTIVICYSFLFRQHFSDSNSTVLILHEDVKKSFTGQEKLVVFQYR